jgi:hypothetical protein
MKKYDLTFIEYSSVMIENQNSVFTIDGWLKLFNIAQYQTINDKEFNILTDNGNRALTSSEFCIALALIDWVILDDINVYES